jgi:hypothetical protein
MTIWWEDEEKHAKQIGAYGTQSWLGRTVDHSGREGEEVIASEQTPVAP